MNRIALRYPFLVVSAMTGLLMLATPAAAQEAVAPEKKLSLGLGLQLMPVGTIKVKLMGLSDSQDTAVAFAVAPSLDYRVSPSFLIGAAPRFIFNVKPTDATESATELDLLARFTGLLPVSPTLTVFGQLAPGYSIIMPSDSGSQQGADFPDPKGLVFDFGAGVHITVAPTVFLVGGVGYQIGLQSSTFSSPGTGDVDVDLKTSYLHIEFGLGVRI